MKFGNLHYLWFLWLIPMVVVFYFIAIRRKNILIERFVSSELKNRLLANFSPAKQKIKILFLLLTLLFSITSLIRPKWGFHWEEVKRKGVDIIVALDVSKSMLAEDISPNRLERAKREIIDLIEILQGDRLGLVAFAGTSFLQSPLTLDYGAVRIFLEDLDTNLIPVPGTAIANAISKSIASFDQQDKKSRVLILITDGEDHAGNPIEASKKANDSNVKIYTIGIGKVEGAPIPDQAGGFKKDRSGNMILTQLDESTLQKVALNTGGSYVRSISGDLDLEKIYKDINQKVEDKELKSGKRKRYEERFQWPLIVAIIFLLLELFLTERTKKIALSIIVLTLISVSKPSYAISFKNKRQLAEEMYGNKKYAKALEKFIDKQIEDPNNNEIKYNLANTYYKTKNYEKAYKLFQAISIDGDKLLSQKSFYNLGNTAFKMGKLQEAVNFYKKSIELDPNDKDAKYNLEFVREEIKKRIEENKKRQKKQKKQQKNKQCDNPNKKQDKNQEPKKEQQEKKKQDQNEQNKEKNKKENKEKKQQNKQKSAGKVDKKKMKKMSKKEAQKWLQNLDENRKKHLKRQMQTQGGYQVDKDW